MSRKGRITFAVSNKGSVDTILEGELTPGEFLIGMNNVANQLLRGKFSRTAKGVLGESIDERIDKQ